MKLVNESRLRKFFQVVVDVVVVVVVVIIVYNRYIIIYIVSSYNILKPIYILVYIKTHMLKNIHASEGLTHTM